MTIGILCVFVMILMCIFVRRDALCLCVCMCACVCVCVCVWKVCDS